MSIERADDHPTHESSGNTITSLAAPARGASEVALFRTELPPGGALPRHRHDHNHLEAGADGATITVAMPGGTKLIREDGSEIVPPWVR